MTYPHASAEQITFFEEHGFVVVADAIPSADLDELERRCDRLLDDRERLANDWAWDEAESLEGRSFRIVQSSPSFVWSDITKAPYRVWLAEFAEALMRRRLEFWYDQFLAKPPGRSVPTAWHQDEGYWGRNLDDQRRHRPGSRCKTSIRPTAACTSSTAATWLGVLPHHLVPGMQSDLLTCEVDERSMIVCPICRGDVTFHHSKTPHMTTANTAKALAQGGQQPYAGGRSGRRGRSLSLEDHGGPEDRPAETETRPEDR